LEQLTGKSPSLQNQSCILLKADINSTQGEWTDQAISQALDISPATIEGAATLCGAGYGGGVEPSSSAKRKPRRLDGEQEAHLLAMLCGPTPEGQGRWTLRLLAEQIVELGYVESVSHETVRQTLKKRTQAVVESVLGDSA